ncbi:MAG: hypothetical protein U5K37_08375 [Natrialbaceae archaeon]|nr:hypothetical protein [Natrialbaceae archaeon]
MNRRQYIAGLLVGLSGCVGESDERRPGPGTVDSPITVDPPSPQGTPIPTMPPPTLEIDYQVSYLGGGDRRNIALAENSDGWIGYFWNGGTENTVIRPPDGVVTELLSALESSYPHVDSVDPERPRCPTDWYPSYWVRSTHTGFEITAANRSSCGRLTPWVINRGGQQYADLDGDIYLAIEALEETVI